MLLSLIFSWEEVKGLFRKLLALTLHTKPKHVQKKYLDQFVADVVFLATLPVGLMVIISASNDFMQNFFTLGIELFAIFAFMEIARFVSRHSKILELDNWGESLVSAGSVISRTHSPFPLARFYKYKFRFGSKLYLDFFSVVASALVGIFVVKNFAPEIMYDHLLELIIIFSALSFSLVTVNHLQPLMHRSRHPFWTNFRLLAGILISTLLLIR